MPKPMRSIRLPDVVRVAVWVPLFAGAAQAARAQSLDDPRRLRGVSVVGLRATASWDELITTDAGGATEAQFRDALGLGLEEAMRGVESGPRLDPDAPSYVLCHVDTAYETGLILYAVRVSYHEPGHDGAPVIAWLRSWVGSYTTQQLHLLWTLADQCAGAFLDAWTEANGRLQEPALRFSLNPPRPARCTAP